MWFSFLAGSPAEFTDAKFPAVGHGREVTRVRSTGTATVQFNVMIKVSPVLLFWRVNDCCFVKENVPVGLETLSLPVCALRQPIHGSAMICAYPGVVCALAAVGTGKSCG